MTNRYSHLPPAKLKSEKALKRWLTAQLNQYVHNTADLSRVEKGTLLEFCEFLRLSTKHIIEADGTVKDLKPPTEPTE